jgi:hypothetical protein
MQVAYTQWHVYVHATYGGAVTVQALLAVILLFATCLINYT